MEGRFQHLKRDRLRLREGTYIRANPKHIVNLLAIMRMEDCNAAPTPFVPKSSEPEDATPLTDDRRERFPKAVGTCIYLALDRWDIQEPVNLLTAYLSEPTEHGWKRLIRLTRYLKGTQDFAQFLPTPTGNQGVADLDMRSDTDYASCKTTRRSLCCGQIFLDTFPYYQFVRRQAVETLSSTESEYYGAVSTVSEGKAIHHLFTWLGFKVKWSLGMDSAGAKAVALRQGVGKIRHLAVRTLWLQRETQNGLVIRKVKGLLNTADFGTKDLDGPRFAELRAKLGFVPGGIIDQYTEHEVFSVEGILVAGEHMLSREQTLLMHLRH